MPVGDRSLADVLRDVIRNVQEIVRSEVRLAKAELREDAAHAKSSMLYLVAGAVAALFAILLLLLTIVSALALVMPIWAALLLPGTIFTVVAIVTIGSGVRRFRQLQPPLGRTVESIKENFEWPQRHNR